MTKDRESDDTESATAPTMASEPGVDGRAHTAPTQIDPLLGQTVAGRYKVISVLGRGGMGTVYVCEHIQLRKRMALKVLAEELRQKSELVTRFLTEARTAAQIGHPNIVDVFDLDQLSGGGAYIAMALLDGEDLQEALRRQGAMPFARARQIVGPICRALAAAHQKGVVHRDMKPANVFLARDADGAEVVKILDFGIALVNHGGEGEAARLTQTGAIVGTPAFMSPEQGRGQRADHRTDIYSVGCILYNLLTGDVPFRAATLMGVITQHLFEPPERPSLHAPPGTVTPEMDAVVLRALAKDPEERFQTMKDMWLAIEACGDSPAAWPDAISGRYERMPSGVARVPARRTEHTEPEVKRPRSRWPLVVAGVAIVAGAGLGLRFLRSTATPPTPGGQAPAEVTLEVRSTPPGATVWRGTEALGRTPLKLVRARGAEALALRLSLDGYEDEQLSLPIDRDRLVELRLAAKPAPTVETKPEATPSAWPEPKPTAKTPSKGGPRSSKPTGKNGDLKDPFR